MKKVLLYIENDIIVYDASTPELELKAYLALFNEFYKMGFYDILDPCHADLFVNARAGDGESARQLLRKRRTYESENYYVRNVSE